MKKYPRPMASITLVGENVRITPGILQKFVKALSDKLINVYNISIGEYSLSLFVDQEYVKKAEEALEGAAESLPSFNSIDLKENMGLISISSSEFVDTPGLINKLTQPLAGKSINIVAISSSFDSILIFLEWENVDSAYETLHLAIVNRKIKL